MYAHANCNDQAIMLGTHVFGDDGGVPCLAECVLAGDERAPSHRRTVLRTANESPAAFQQRVVDTVRELKASRPYDHTVSIFYSTHSTRTAAEWFMRDARWNLRQIAWQAVMYERNPKRRVTALCRMADRGGN